MSIADRLPARVLLRDVSLRDGLQDEEPIPTDAKIAIFEALVAAGVRDLEVTSFVRPDRVPAMADAEAVCAATAELATERGVTRWGLVLNTRGAQRAVAAGLTHLQYVVSVSDTHSRHNAGAGTDEALDEFARFATEAIDAGAVVEMTLATAMGCPFEHRVDPDRVVEVARRAADAGASSIGLADTIGVAVPTEVAVLVDLVRSNIEVPIGVHLHDTRGLAIANAVVALEHGASRLDASVGGLGGCPFAPNASGNVPIEDLAHALRRDGCLDGRLARRSGRRREPGMCRGGSTDRQPHRPRWTALFVAGTVVAHFAADIHVVQIASHHGDLFALPLDRARNAATMTVDGEPDCDFEIMSRRGPDLADFSRSSFDWPVTTGEPVNTSLGGEVVLPPALIPEIHDLRIARIVDPQGNMIGLAQRR